MSFRDLCTFTEMMRGLGYPRLISMENFRSPNFELVADILFWLVQRYDPGIDISDDISSEQDRVIFIKNISHIMATKARIKLNPKRLYQADGYAVKEMLKVAAVLYNAMRAQEHAGGDDDDDAAIDASASKLYDVKTIRTLASQITQHTAELYDALGDEPELRDARRKALSRHVELEEVERAVKKQIALSNEELTQRNQTVANLDQDLANLRSKIDKKRSELERNQKRLLSLQSVRPHFMDEYEQLEEQLQNLYKDYLERFRNLHFLEHDLDSHEATEHTAAAAQQQAQAEKRQAIVKDQRDTLLGGEDFGGDGNPFGGLSDSDSFGAPRSGRTSGRNSSRNQRPGARPSGPGLDKRLRDGLLADDDTSSDTSAGEALDDLAASGSGSISVGDDDVASDDGDSFSGGDPILSGDDDSDEDIF
eukprot:TRINITY_DN37870_c0_g1_i1.p1 TRINITY_DN37870_c0_g1~~TRINITY_DN37870_c0_g1_i1.p1  ORF type:complete len:422 (+),score=99.82 TRINITY_DN37870_c0_g1_i1:368-1633(+)